MYQIIGCLPTAPATARDFIGGRIPTTDPWKPYIIKALPAGLIIQHGKIYWMTTGEGVERCERPGEMITHHV